jgi:riboflavin synthase
VLQSIVKGASSARLRVSAPLIVTDVKPGDSIAVNGVCLTVTAFDSLGFTAEAMAETLSKTNLGDLRPGEKVNLERALRLSDRLGGHLVSGHVDGVGTIIRQTSHDIALITEISYPPLLEKYLVPRGSVAVDGISLTITGVNSGSFTVSLIPHTRGMTTLGFKKAGDKVNIEADLIARYLGKLSGGANKGQDDALKNSEAGGLSLSFLAEHGFV